MPTEDGYALIRHIRQNETQRNDIPAIALTAYARAEDREKALLAGFDLHLAKPIDPDELIRALSQLVKQGQ